MEHRRFLLDPPRRRPFVGSALFERIGGRGTVDALVDGLYDGIERDIAARRAAAAEPAAAESAKPAESAEPAEPAEDARRTPGNA